MNYLNNINFTWSIQISVVFDMKISKSNECKNCFPKLWRENWNAKYHKANGMSGVFYEWRVVVGWPSSFSCVVMCVWGQNKPMSLGKQHNKITILYTFITVYSTVFHCWWCWKSHNCMHTLVVSYVCTRCILVVRLSLSL